jgi:hypothetical protein
LTFVVQTGEQEPGRSPSGGLLPAVYTPPYRWPGEFASRRELARLKDDKASAEKKIADIHQQIETVLERKP